MIWCYGILYIIWYIIILRLLTESLFLVLGRVLHFDVKAFLKLQTLIYIYVYIQVNSSIYRKVHSSIYFNNSTQIVKLVN